MSIFFALLGFLLQTTAPAAPPQPAPGNPVVVIETSFGTITAELYKDRAPVSVENFLEYARAGHYNGTLWHRVVPGYVIQGGGYTPKFVEKPTRPPIQNEATNGLSNSRGTLAMARLRSARSATSQFYINLSNNAALDHRGFAPDSYGYGVRPRPRGHGRRRQDCRGENRHPERDGRRAGDPGRDQERHRKEVMIEKP